MPSGSDDKFGQVFTDLDNMSWEDLLRLRQKYANDPEKQRILAPYEHRAYAREYAAKGPAQAASLAVAIPGYQLFKAAGLGAGDATSPSFDQLFAGYQGLMEGARK